MLNRENKLHDTFCMAECEWYNYFSWRMISLLEYLRTIRIRRGAEARATSTNGPRGGPFSAAGFTTGTATNE